MEDIKLIVGLGNPEPQYSNTRHNLGFDIINKLQENSNIKVKDKKYKSLFGIGKLYEKEVMLLKPQTYMNNSGEAVIEVVKKYNLKPENILVIYDDMDIEPGRIKIRKQGEAGSHNGVKSLLHFLESNKFARVRIRIGRPFTSELNIPYVIGQIPESESQKIEENRVLAYNAVIDILNNGLDYAMNKYN